MAKTRLTPAFVKTASCPDGKRKIEFFDTDESSLSLEVRASGGKTYYRRYRDARGRIRQIKLGAEGDLSLAAARKLSSEVGGRVALGEDPLAAKKIVKATPTFSQFIEEQLTCRMFGLTRRVGRPTLVC